MTNNMNIGIAPSQFLTTGSQAQTTGTWDAVNWGAANWNSDYWGT